MTWLFPLYLLGAAAIIGPILMHLRRRPPQERVEFSSLMFLDAQTPMPVSNRRLENLLLLLLRCLALILLALMFARPLWRQDDKAAVGHQQATVFLLDRSASMQRGDLWKQAVSLLEQRLSAAGIEDRVSVALFDREVQSLWSLAEDRKSASTRAAMVKQRLAQTRPGWASTDLGQALVDVASWFGSEAGMTGLKKRIVVISDLQEGTKLDALRSRVWPETVTVEVQRVSVPDTDNLSLSLAASTAEAAVEKDKAPRNAVRVRIGNARDSKVSDYTLNWEKGGAEPVNGYLPPGASRVLSAPLAADESQARILRLSGDAWDFDNQVFVAPLQPKPVRLVFIGDAATRDEAASPLFYLSRALQPTATLLPELQIVSPSAAALPEAVNIVFISGAALGEPLTKALRSFMDQGGMVVKVIDENTTAGEVAGLAGVQAGDITLKKGAAGEDYRMLAEVDTSHRLLSHFADDRLRDFTKLRFWKHREIELKEVAAKSLQVIARFDNQDPAILTAPVGQGAFILLTSGWHPADSQLALSTKFVPLLYGWLEAAGFRNEQAASLLVGDVLPSEAETTIMTPDGQTLKPKTGETVRAASMGFYTLQSEPPQTLAVNLPPEESRIAPMDAEKLRELGVLLEDGIDAATAAKADERERLATGEQEGRQRAWFWLLAAMLGVLGMETWLSGRIREGKVQPAYS